MGQKQVNQDQKEPNHPQEPLNQMSGSFYFNRLEENDDKHAFQPD